MKRKIPKMPTTKVLIFVALTSIVVVFFTAVFSLHIYRVVEQYTGQTPKVGQVSSQQTSVSELLNHLSLLQVSLLTANASDELIEHQTMMLNSGLKSFRAEFADQQNDLIFQIDFALSQLILQLQSPKSQDTPTIQVANSARNDLFLLQRNLIDNETTISAHNSVLLNDISNSVKYGFVLAIAVFVYTLLFFASSKKAVAIHRLMRQSNSYLEMVLNNAQAAVIVTNNNGEIVDVNETVESLTLYPPDELMGKSVDLLLDVESLSEINQACLETNESKVQMSGLSLIKKGEEEVSVDVSFARVQDGKSTVAIYVLRPISEEQKLNKRLVDNQKVLAQSQLIAKFGSWFWDLNENSIDWSDAAETIYGLSREELGHSFNNIVTFVHPQDRDHVVDAIQNTVILKSDFNISYRLITGDQIRYIEEVGKANIDEDGEVSAILGTVRDVTQARMVNEQLAMSESVFANAQDGILVTNAKGQIQRINQAFTALTGYGEQESLGKHPDQLLESSEINEDVFHPYWHTQKADGEWHGEWWLTKANGEPFLTDQYITQVSDEDGKVVRYLAIINDITEKRKLEEVMRQKAYFDGLTNLPNRSLFHDRLKMKLSELKRKQGSFALCFLDLDGFKAINDTHGHDMGDQVLIRTAQRLSDSIRESDTVSRLAGDEFTLILDSIEDETTALEMAEKLIQKVNRDITYDNITVNVGASFGVVIVNNESHQDMNLLIKQADHAMYQAKTAGKNRAVLFDNSQIN